MSKIIKTITINGTTYTVFDENTAGLLTELENNVDTNYVKNTDKGVTVATLEDGKIPLAQIPDEIVGGGDIDLSDYATKAELANYATTEALNTGLADKADKTQLTNLATKTELNAKADASDLANYVTTTDANNNYLGKTAKAESAKTADSVDWANVQSKPSIPANTSDLNNDSNFITATYLTDNKYVTSEALDDKADVTALANYIPLTEKGTTVATLEDGKVPLSQIPSELIGGGDVDLSDYVTKTELSEKGYITNAALANYVTNEALEGKGYLTAVPAEYVTETELSGKNYITSEALTGYATTEALTSGLQGKADISALTAKLDATEVANEANKIPRFTADGHLIIPANGIEIW